MDSYPASLERLSDHFARLPGIGRKSAQRLAFHVLEMSNEDAQSFADAIMEARQTIHCCPRCQNLTDDDLCSICSDAERDQHIICVVADPKDVAAIEKSREYKGIYHVLHGVISPLGNVGPEDIRIRELLQRVASEDVQEIIMATNPDTEGEATALYLARILKPFGVPVTRLAYGISVGSQLEYTDALTLSRALEGRLPME